MKRILFAAALIAASQAALAGPIQDEYARCTAHAETIYHQCRAGASNNGEISQCVLITYPLIDACYDVAKAKIDLNHGDR